ncbi:Uncharacterised protein [Kluyvera cryocrescens]|uniref:Uncharacterized protein n=1 Tax=Kluyvera cryocrescens TaxID=580 RepID=A0A485AKD8_KLUCR|nr:Uncharacterised protein [Kluyvera cryocrescens]
MLKSRTDKDPGGSRRNPLNPASFGKRNILTTAYDQMIEYAYIHELATFYHPFGNKVCLIYWALHFPRDDYVQGSALQR